MEILFCIRFNGIKKGSLPIESTGNQWSNLNLAECYSIHWRMYAQKLLRLWQWTAEVWSVSSSSLVHWAEWPVSPEDEIDGWRDHADRSRRSWRTVWSDLCSGTRSTGCEEKLELSSSLHVELTWLWPLGRGRQRRGRAPSWTRTMAFPMVDWCVANVVRSIRFHWVVIDEKNAVDCVLSEVERVKLWDSFVVNENWTGKLNYGRLGFEFYIGICCLVS